MALLHLRQDRVARVVDYYRDAPGFVQSMIWLLESDVMDRRKDLQEQRHQDDDWFFTRFDCQL